MAATRLENPVACAVPVAVVDRLEVVDVDHEATEEAAVPLGPPPFLFGTVEERATIQASSEWVAGRQ